MSVHAFEKIANLCRLPAVVQVEVVVVHTLYSGCGERCVPPLLCCCCTRVIQCAVQCTSPPFTPCTLLHPSLLTPSLLHSSPSLLHISLSLPLPPSPGLPRPRSSSQGAISPAPDEPSPYAVASAARLPSREKTPPAVAPKPTSSSQYAKVNKVAMTRKRSASPPSSPPPPPPGKSDSQCRPSLMEAE